MLDAKTTRAGGTMRTARRKALPCRFRPPVPPAPEVVGRATVQPLLVDALTAARLLGISPRLLWSLTRKGEIRHVRIGRRVLYDPPDLRTWIDSRKVGGRPALEGTAAKSLDGGGGPG
jgi:excisionase family DNA binding protein